MKFVCWRCWNVECKKDKELRKSKAPKCRLLKKAYGIQHYAGRFGRGLTLAPTYRHSEIIKTLVRMKGKKNPEG